MLYSWTTSIHRLLALRDASERALEERTQLERLQVRRFRDTVLRKAMQRVGCEFERQGRQVEIADTGNIVSMIVVRAGRVEFSFSAAASRSRPARKKPGRHPDATGYARDVDRVYSLRETRKLDADDICREIVGRYRRTVLASQHGRALFSAAAGSDSPACARRPVPWPPPRARRPPFR